MRITYDPVADAAYIYLVEEVVPGEPDGGNIIVCDTEVLGSTILIERDKDKKLLGIEILGAAALLRAETRDQAEQ